MNTSLEETPAGQKPDTRSGYYYVTVRRPRYGSNAAYEYRLLRGPFVNDHARALAAVDEARSRAIDCDPRACWYEYGTGYSETDLGPGIFDKLDADPAQRAPEQLTIATDSA